MAGGGGAALKIVTLPSGEGPAFAGEVEAALGKSQSAFERLLSSDDYGIGLKVLDEEFKQSHDSAFDVLKRRAELQNIALVKTSDGFVLAPMHEGRVVKTEVFRSLPEGLQRDVESKISGLEDELKALISDVPGHVAAYGEKLAALNTEVAVRALGPQLAHVRTLFTGSTEAADALDALESLLVAHAARTVGAKGRAGVSEVFNIRLIARDPGVGGDGMAPAVTAWDVSAPGLSGELGRDTDGRLTLKPGALMQANGGFLIVDAWRLAAMPGAWEALSAALEQGFVRPISSHGLIASCEALPLSVRLILVADEASWRRLETLDPGIARYFSSIARFAATVPSGDVSEADFSNLAAAIARGRSMRMLDKAALKPLYQNALSRAGRGGRISLDIAALTHILAGADDAAEKAGASEIRARDIEDVVRHRTSVVVS